MCFSPAASFAAAAVLAPVGVVALRSARSGRELPLAALPLLFAVHQAVEGVVWLGLEGDVGPGLESAAVRAYLAIAQVVVPVLVPLAIWRAERDPARRRAVAGFLVLGVLVAVRMLAIQLGHPAGAAADGGHLITYDTDTRFGYVEAVAYVVATCGAALASGSAALRRFGLVALAGLGIALLIRYTAVTSVWCLYAALASALILAYLREGRNRSDEGGLLRAARRPGVVDGGHRPRL